VILRISFDREGIQAAGLVLPDFAGLVKQVQDKDGRFALDIPMFGRIEKLSAADLERVKPEALSHTAEITSEAIIDFLRTGSPALASTIVARQMAAAPAGSAFPIVVEVENVHPRVDGKWARPSDLLAA
jgi:hypothetical protein